MATDLATLMVKVDSTEAGKAAGDLDKLTAAGKRTNVTVEQAERYMRKASVVLGDMAAAERKAAADADRLASSTKGAGAAAADMAREAQRAASATGGYRAGLQQLGFQLQDFAVQTASGTSATRAFAQQFPQAIGAVTMMTGATGRLGAFLGGPWGIALGVAAAALGPLIANLFEAAAAADTARQALQSLIEKQRAQAREYASLAQGQIGLNKLREQSLALELKIDAQRARNKASGNARDAFLYADLQKQRDLQMDLAEAQAAVNIEVANQEAATKRMTKAHEAATGRVSAHAGSARGYAGAAGAAVKATNEWEKALQDIEKGSAMGLVDILRDMHDEIKAITKVADEDLATALEDAARKGEQHFDDLNEAIQRTQEQVNALINSIGNMGGLGGILGDIGSILTSKNPIASMLGMGGVGTILGSVLGGKDVTDKMGLEFQKAIKLTFPGLNDELATKIGGTLANLFQGAGIGGAVGGIMGGGKAGAFGATAGGALGQVFGEKFLAKGLESIAKGLGDFAGPIGSIAGAVLGNLLGGVLGGTKRGGATIGAGGVMGTWGNSQQRIGAATGMGNNAVDALSQLAAALGVNLGSFSSSISVRKNDLRFDPTGSGISKTSKGAISFGQDEQALLAAVIKDAIADGAFEGLSEGFKNYLTSGDVESRLQDVLNLKSVMNEAAQIRDPQGFALGELDKWRTSMLAIATATGEGMADIETVYANRRKEILEQFGTDTVQLEKDRKALLIQIAELEGRSTEALAMARQMELDAADESLRPLMQRIYQLQDEAVEVAKAAEAAAELKRITDERYGLETQLLQLLGDTNALRERERATVSEANRDIFDRIEAIKAEQAAAQEAARLALERADRIRSLAQEDFALQMRLAAAGGGDVTKLQRENELRQASSDLVRQRLLEIYAIEDLTAAQTAQAEAAKRIADERLGLETRLLQLQGDTAALRQRELDALDPANRALLQMIFNLEDTQAAADAAAKAAEELAARNKAIADEIAGLNRQWLELTGQTEELRKLDLAALQSDEARAIQQQIWDYTDALEAQKAAQEAAAKAADEYTRRLEEARNALSAAYERESSALQGTIDKFSDFAKTIREFREGLTVNPAFGYAQARSRFANTATMAGFGNEASLQAFTGDAQAFLDQSRGRAATLQDYLRDVSFVSRSAKSAEGGALGVVSAAEKQLKQLEKLVEGYIDLNENVLTVHEAIENLQKIETEQTIPVLTDVIGGGLVKVQEELVLTRDQTALANNKSQKALEASAIALSRVERLLARVIREDSLIVSNDTALTVTVGNTAANPVPVDTTP